MWFLGTYGITTNIKRFLPEEVEARAVGGQNAQLGQWPWQVKFASCLRNIYRSMKKFDLKILFNFFGCRYCFKIKNVMLKKWMK